MATTPERPTSPTAWQQLLEQWQRSGLSQRAFAERVGLHPAALSYWKRKLAAGDAHATTAAAVAPTFVPVALAAPTPAPPAPWFELALSHGGCLRIPPDFDAAALTRLLATLRGVAC